MFDINEEHAKINGKSCKLIEYSPTIETVVECNLEVLSEISSSEYPYMLVLKISAPDLLSNFETFVDDDGFTIYGGKIPDVGLSFSPDRNYCWKNGLSFGAVANAAILLVETDPRFKCLQIEYSEPMLHVHQDFPTDEGQDLKEFVSVFVGIVEELMSTAEISINGYAWRKEYEEDEALFTQSLLIPLLSQMGFDNVRYNHGTAEYGRDILFSERNRFGNCRLLAAQVKAGNISGGANSIVDTIVAQIEDAFSMEVEQLGASLPRRISEMLIVTSGRFTNNARQKIDQKVPRCLVGSITYWDKEDVLHQIRRHLTR